ncbi:chloride channel protein [Faunimonas pinastri]|uniref:chloride channel protein n=1 Tax=Faunimonas pinastri TaxID=1855383 RepID=UPI001EE9C7F3|nr:chloride channel protein [Faunimonas pinastri]
MRRSEIWLVFMALVVGAIAGLMVVVASYAANWLHAVLFGLEDGEYLSAMASLKLGVSIFVPAIGGLLLALFTRSIVRWRQRRPVDPIEANALHGGQMSLTDSILITVQTVISNGFGASVGLEAGYTQIGSGIASRLGSAFSLRRSDMRIMVGCGSAGAIAAAFGAPLTGAFYAFELIVGTYTISSLAPIVGAAISGVLVAQALGSEPHHLGHIDSATAIGLPELTMLVLLAILCAGAGVAIMRGATLLEEFFQKSRIPVLIRPAIGGLALGAMALITPQVLSAGHGALYQLMATEKPALGMLALVLLLKACASAISLGSGFRGGLFFASLFLGSLLGRLYAGLIVLYAPELAPDPIVAATIGMTGLAVAIVGGPLTMGFLALETTGDLPLSVAVLATAAVVSLTVRKTFGYSFATWRLHLRGESIRGAHDVGWMRALTVSRLMRKDVRTISADMTVREFRRAFPLGSTQRVVATDGESQYAGIVDVAEAHLASLDETADTATVRTILRTRESVLLPWMNIKQAAVIFEKSESEALAVVSAPGRNVVGFLTEAHALRRYTEELDKARRELSGETWARDEGRAAVSIEPGREG